MFSLEPIDQSLGIAQDSQAKSKLVEMSTEPGLCNSVMEAQKLDIYQACHVANLHACLLEY